MKLEGEGMPLRVFIGESDRWHHHPLYEAIVMEARKQGLAGATVLRGPMGYGANSRIHTAKILRLSEDLPLVIEMVDTAAAIEAFLPSLDEMVTEGLITLEKVQIVRYRHREKWRGPEVCHGWARFPSDGMTCLEGASPSGHSTQGCLPSARPA